MKLCCKSKLLSILLVVLMVIPNVISTTVYAADAVPFPQKAVDYTLGTQITFSIGDSDYVTVNGDDHYYKVYRINMPKQGILRFFIDEPENYYWYFNIFKANDINNMLSEVDSGDRKYNNATGTYQTSCETALDAGEYYILVDVGNYYTEDEPINLTMTYIAPKVRVAAVSLNSGTLRMEVGTTQKLVASVTPANATNKGIVWKSEDPAVATVANGVITAKAPGTTKIVATSADGGASTFCTVTVPPRIVNVSQIKLNYATVKMLKGSSFKLTATVLPANATRKGIIWSTSAPEVASIDSTGAITAKIAGSTVITATSTDGIHYAKCTIVVYNPDRTAEIKAIKKAKTSITKLKAGKKKLTAIYKTNVKNVKFQIAYRKGSGKWKTVSSAKTKKIIKKLSRKKKYQVKVRCYKVINGNIYYSNWSKVKKVKVK